MAHAIPYVSDTRYRSPEPSSTEDHAVLCLLRNHDVKQEELTTMLRSFSVRSVQLSSCLIDYIVRVNRADLLSCFLKYEHLNFDFHSPVHAAVVHSSLPMLEMLLSDPRIDVNVGCPLLEAVRRRERACVAALLRCEYVNPNKGCALFQAVHQGDLDIVKLLTGCPQVNVNRFTPGQGTTPLCCAIVEGHEDIFCFLLSHPKIDINKGFLSTPLQLCAMHERTNMARVLLAKPTLLINRVLGTTATAVEIAFEKNTLDIFRMLIADNRTQVPLSVINRLEASNDVASLQQIADVSGCTMGRVWMMRFAACVLNVVVCCLQSIADVRLMVESVRIGLMADTVLVALCHCSACMTASLLLLRARIPRGAVVLRLVPFSPFFDVVMLTLMVRSVTHQPNLRKREDFFRAMFVSAMVHSFLCLTLAVLQAYSLYRHVYVVLLPNCVACLIIYVLGIARGLYVWARRLQTRRTYVTADDSEPLELV